MERERTVQIISAKKAITPEKREARVRRVAGYARVSTDKDEQFTSYASQIEYYTKYIEEHEGWSLVKIYSDEGISGTSTKHRVGFRQMIADALDGKIDLIITKSISRFARNTVDSLTTIRRLKDAGVECFFEKENIFTFDSKGEFLITILSSLAQEESRSLSENVTWGTRRRFADGKYYIHYSEFLGYRRGEDGSPEVDEKEASVVRRIFYMCVEGNGPYFIAKTLSEEGIKTAMGKDKWHASVVKSILQNEKYIGDALLQKTYCTDFLTKKRKKNEGEIPKYYVENGHPAIVSKELFDSARAALEKYEATPHRALGSALRLRCAVCGCSYVKTVWKEKGGDKMIWRCGKKFRRGNCMTPYLYIEQIDEIIRRAKSEVALDRALIISALPSLVTGDSALRAYESELDEIRDADSKRRREVLKLVDEATKTNEAVRMILSGDAPDAAKLIPPERVIDTVTISPKYTVTVHLKGSDDTLEFDA